MSRASSTLAPETTLRYRDVMRLALLTLVTLIALPATACTAFLLERAGARVVGKSYDWNEGRGHVTWNPAGVSRRALVPPSGGTPARWSSRYASLTFNQFGHELPNAGMNDQGLVVEILWLSESSYPKADALPAHNPLSWVQYLLDQAANLDEATALARKVRVVPMAGAKVHWFACDRSGECAVFEYLQGALTVTRGRQLGPKVITNDTCAASRVALGRSHGRVPAGRASLARYVRTAVSLAAVRREHDLVTAAFTRLDNVRQGDYTKWQVVYEPGAAKVHWRVGAGVPWRTIRMGTLDSRCVSGARILDVATESAGDVTGRLVPYSGLANRTLVRGTFATLGAPDLADLVAVWPDGSTCQ